MMLTGEFTVTAGGIAIPVNGATVYAYPASGFATLPVKNTALPATGMVTSGSTAAANGADGAYRLGPVTAADYCVAIQYDGQLLWDYLSAAGAGPAGLAGVAGVTLTNPADGQGLVYQGSSAAWINQAPKYAACLSLMSAFSPSATGADLAELIVPFSPVDGTTVLSFNVRRLNFRAAASGSTSSQVTIQKSTGTGLFSGVTVGTVTLPASGCEAFVTAALGTVQSGDKLRTFVNSLGTATSWSIDVELGQ